MKKRTKIPKANKRKKDSGDNADLNEEDKTLWRRAMGIEEEEVDNEEDFSTLLDEIEEKSTPKDIKKEENKPEKNSSKSQKNYKNSDIDARTNEKLRRGQMPIDKVIDLHGMNQVEAYAYLSKNIQNAYLSGKRCVLVITGKGKTRLASDKIYDEEKGILRKKTPEWLSEQPFKEYVLVFHPAKPKHGGTGALYVYLRKK